MQAVPLPVFNHNHNHNQAVCLVGAKTISFFIHKNRSRNCDTGWVLCYILMAFNWIPFKPQKGTPTIVTPST